MSSRWRGLLGLEPAIVGLAEFGVMDDAGFETGDGVDWPIEMLSDDSQREAEVLASEFQLVSLDDRGGVDQGLIDLAGDVPFQATHDRAF